jgi:hypothetical protein
MMAYIRYIAIFFLVILNFGYQTVATLDGHVNYRVYGHLYETPLNKDISSLKIGQLTQKDFFTTASYVRSLGLDKTANNIKRIALEYHLDDLGLTIFIKKFAENVYPNVEQYNEVVLLQYFLLKELGYDVLLTKTGTTLNCLGNLSFSLGQFIFIHYSDKTYIDLDFSKRAISGEQHLIYQDVARTYKTIERNLLNRVKFNGLSKSKDIKMQYRGTDYLFSVTSNLSYLQYLNDLPTFDLGRDYSRMPFSQMMKKSLLDNLRIITSEMTKVEGARFLLHFVQNVVPYGDDFSKYGGERYYYPEETVMCSNADCEDKAFLLGYLLRELLKIESVGLFFKEDKHISLALNLEDYNHPNAFKYKGKNYIPCEPTGKNAKLGYSATDLKRVTEVIPL